MSWYNPMTWFGSQKSVEKTVDNVFDKDNGLLTQVGGWIGGMQFTEEEQAEYKMAVADKAAKFVGDTLSENTERSKARRDVANMWIKMQLALVGLTAICLPWDRAMAKDYFNLATSDVMLWGTGSILVFFFGGYVWGTHINKGAKK